MPAYDESAYSPPAPIALVRVENSSTGKFANNVTLLLDTGADITLLPRSAVKSLLPDLTDLPRYELIGFDGNRSTAQAVNLEIRFLEKLFRGQFLLTDEPHGVLGRNILNKLSINFNGPTLTWREAARQV